MQAAARVSPDLQRLVEQCEREDNMERIVSGTIQFNAGNYDYEAILIVYESQFPGFQASVKGQQAVFDSPVKHINELGQMNEIAQISLPQKLSYGSSYRI